MFYPWSGSATLLLLIQFSVNLIPANTNFFSGPVNERVFLKGKFGIGLDPIAVDFRECLTEDAESQDSCVEYTHDGSKVHLTVYQALNETEDIDCSTVNWEAEDCTTDALQVCYDLADVHWYGGTLVREQYWPIEGTSHYPAPYVTGNVAGVPPGYGGVLERYWVNSDGMALYVDWEVPLWVSVNASGNQLLCLRSQYLNSPYSNYQELPVSLRYTVCQGRDVRHVHDYMAAKYLPKPTDIPDERLFRHPIWSTWAQYRKNITQDLVLEFADEIVANGFANAQLEIDDKWEAFYGDLDFDREKFPDPAAMVAALASKGFRTTLWVHTFVGLDSPALADGLRRRLFVTDSGGRQPGLTAWWDEASSMLVDFTNDRAVEWHADRLRSLQTNYNISSFKFDAGESNWLPDCYRLSPLNRTNPSWYSTRYVEMAYGVDPDVRHQEVRVGARTQHVPIFLRMFDKDSRWGYSNGIETLIPHALNVGIIGYPFVLPDMVGGNGYVVFPDRELYVRWAQVNALLPSVQFSIVPWQFDAEVVEITRNMTHVHESYAQKFIDLARESTATGAPIVRPLWWIAPTDPVALTVDSEFLVGDDLLVAPVVKEGARSRDIYLPAGRWHDELRDADVDGGLWLLDYRVELNELPYFTKIA